MDRTPDDILVERIGALAKQASPLGFGGWGARWTARRLKDNVYETRVHASVEVDTAVQQITAALTEMGGHIGTEGTGDSTHVRGILYYGLGNLSPAVLDAVIAPASPGTTVRLVGTAKESALIKERGGEKVVKKLLDHLGWQEMP